MIYEITLVFDDFDQKGGDKPLLALDDVMLYAENLGRELYSFKHLCGYEGFRVETKEGLSTEEFARLTQP